MTERDEYELSVLRAVNEMPGDTASDLAQRKVAYFYAMFRFDHPVLGPPARRDAPARRDGIVHTAACERKSPGAV